MATTHDDDPTIGGSGCTLEELSAYLDRGRVPPIAAIEHDAEARSLLDAMERLGAAARANALAVDGDASASRTAEADVAGRAGAVRIEPSDDRAWQARVLEVVRREVRSGADLPLARVDERTTASIAEGALREVARRAGDGVGEVLVTRVRVRRVAATETAPELLDVAVSLGVRFGAVLRARGDAVRAAIRSALEPVAPSPIRAIDVVIDDVLDALPAVGRTR